MLNSVHSATRVSSTLRFWHPHLCGHLEKFPKMSAFKPIWQKRNGWIHGHRTTCHLAVQAHLHRLMNISHGHLPPTPAPSFYNTSQAPQEGALVLKACGGSCCGSNLHVARHCQAVAYLVPGLGHVHRYAIDLRGTHVQLASLVPKQLLKQAQQQRVRRHLCEHAADQLLRHDDLHTCPAQTTWPSGNLSKQVWAKGGLSAGHKHLNKYVLSESSSILDTWTKSQAVYTCSQVPLPF